MIINMSTMKDENSLSTSRPYGERFRERGIFGTLAFFTLTYASPVEGEGNYTRIYATMG